MRCHICNTILEPEHIHWNMDHKDFDPCPRCLMEISEVFEDPLDEDEITRLLDFEENYQPEIEPRTEEEVMDEFFP